ncbi:hypothetical protein GCM10009839_90550 [Catenulispora yoronensis]|uniref:Uncharacterized protein n=1 Tax=Catenulispora yoronensis TaxID=450799 RepID=A0ABP5H6B8_9ACTN
MTEAFAAVVDGATDKSGRRYDGLTGGRLAMLVLCDAVAELRAEVGVAEAVAALTAALADRLPEDLPLERPSASITIYSAARRELWQVGDVGFWFPGNTMPPANKQVDAVNVAIRTAILRAELLLGRTVAELAADDPGRAAALPLLRRQAVFANNEAAGDLAFGSLDGRPVPPALIRVIPVPAEVSEVVLASDGYPAVLPTLAESEAHLRGLLEADPLCIGPLAATKGLEPGALGYDDRAYLRMDVSS